MSAFNGIMKPVKQYAPYIFVPHSWLFILSTGNECVRQLTYVWRWMQQMFSVAYLDFWCIDINANGPIKGMNIRFSKNIFPQSFVQIKKHIIFYSRKRDGIRERWNLLPVTVSIAISELVISVPNKQMLKNDSILKWNYLSGCALKMNKFCYSNELRIVRFQNFLGIDLQKAQQ